MNTQLQITPAIWHDPIVQELHEIRENWLKNTMATYTRIPKLHDRMRLR